MEIFACHQNLGMVLQHGVGDEESMDGPRYLGSSKVRRLNHVSSYLGRSQDDKCRRLCVLSDITVQYIQ